MNPRRRLGPVGRAAVIAMGMFLVLVVVAAAWGITVIRQGSDQTDVNGAMVTLLLAVSGCTLADSPEVCRQRQVDRSAHEGNVRVADVDCRIRHALEGRPPLAFGAACTDP